MILIKIYLPEVGATKSSFTLAFCCNVSRLIDNKEFVFGSPMTTHQPSSRFYTNKKQQRYKRRALKTCRKNSHHSSVY